MASPYKVTFGRYMNKLKATYFNNWAVIGPNDDSGLGRMNRDARTVLGIGNHLVLNSQRFFTRPLGDGDTMFGPDLPDDKVRELISGRDGLLLIEQYHHPRLLCIARAMKIPTVCIPMWEWFRSTDQVWRLCDLFVCPNQHCFDMLAKVGFHNTVVLPTPLDLSILPVRQVTGTAKVFVHNAGWVDWDDRKGTRDVIRAFSQLNQSNIRLIVRMQKEVALPAAASDYRIEIRVGNLEAPGHLYSEGEVAVQPSKMEGIGFMVLEPICCGLPVITLDYGPMNEYVRHKALLAQLKPFARRAYASQWVKQAHLRLPSSRSIVRCMQWCIKNDLSSISLDNRSWAEATFAPVRLLDSWIQCISSRFAPKLKSETVMHKLDS